MSDLGTTHLLASPTVRQPVCGTELIAVVDTVTSVLERVDCQRCMQLAAAMVLTGQLVRIR